jgi:hypothetical protein
MDRATLNGFHAEVVKLAVSGKWVDQMAHNGTLNNPVKGSAMRDRLRQSLQNGGKYDHALSTTREKAQKAVQGSSRAHSFYNAALPNMKLPGKSKLMTEMLSKKSSAGNHAIELAGLGILARPTIQKMRGKEVSEKSEHLHELAGLGVLAAPSAVELGKAGLGKLRSMRKVTSLAKTSSFDVWNPSSGAVSGSHVGSRAANLGTAVGAASSAAKKVSGSDMMRKIQDAKKALAAGKSGTVKLNSARPYTQNALSLFR